MEDVSFLSNPGLPSTAAFSMCSVFGLSMRQRNAADAWETTCFLQVKYAVLFFCSKNVSLLKRNPFPSKVSLQNWGLFRQVKIQSKFQNKRALSRFPDELITVISLSQEASHVATDARSALEAPCVVPCTRQGHSRHSTRPLVSRRNA